jgi:diaminopimelate epimerase
MRAAKGHGTENDFVLLPDLDGGLRLTPELVRALCDRRAGIGGDGVLRLVRTDNDEDGKPFAAEAEYFMDYRNADGSLAETCGNGLRVFVRYLQRLGLVGHSAAVATRGGVMRARSGSDGDITVAMGAPRILADRPVVTAAESAERRSLAVLTIPNPHVIVEVEDEDALAGLDLTTAPRVDPALPHGQNVEFVVRRGPRHLAMRVHERGSGETRSCGTGICAAVAAVATAEQVEADGAQWRVDVPGGRCTVAWTADGMELSGPAVIVADLELDERWMEAARAQRR